jgi:hypothetical protein
MNCCRAGHIYCVVGRRIGHGGSPVLELGGDKFMQRLELQATLCSFL